MDRQPSKELERRLDGLDENHRRLDARLEQSMRENTERFDNVEARLEQSVKENAKRFDRVDARGDRIEARLEQSNKENAERFDQADARDRHTHVVLEKIQSNIDLIAEGVLSVNQRLDQSIESIEKQRRQDRAETSDGFRALNRRDDQLDVRVTRLEAAQARTGKG